MTERAAMEKRIAGALRVTIAAHGPIGLEEIGSASKRLYGMLFGNEARAEAAPTREPLGEVRLEGKRVVIRVGDLVEVAPSRPGKRDGWTGTVTELFRTEGHRPTVVVHDAERRILRSLSPERIRGRRRTTQEARA